MAVIALTSASGSPGVTTTAVAFAFLWPRPVVLVEADPTGGSAVLAGYFRGTREYDVGIIELALSALSPSDALREAIRLIPETHVSLLAGTRSRTQAAALRDVWAPLAETLGQLEENGQDVVIVLGGVPATVAVVVGRLVGEPVGITPLAAVFGVRHSVGVVIVPIALVDHFHM